MPAAVRKKAALDPRLAAFKAMRTGEGHGAAVGRVVASGSAGAGCYVWGFGKGFVTVFQELCAGEVDAETLAQAVADEEITQADVAEYEEFMAYKRQQALAKAVNGRTPAGVAVEA